MYLEWIDHFPEEFDLHRAATLENLQRSPGYRKRINILGVKNKRKLLQILRAEKSRGKKKKWLNRIWNICHICLMILGNISIGSCNSSHDLAMTST